MPFSTCLYRLSASSKATLTRCGKAVCLPWASPVLSFSCCSAGPSDWFGSGLRKREAVEQPAEADGAREARGGRTVTHARRSLAGALGGFSVGAEIPRKRKQMPADLSAVFPNGPVDLYGPLLKAARAEEHARELIQRLDTWRAGPCYGLESEPHP